MRVGSLGWEDPLEEDLIFLPGESHEQRSLAGYSPWGHKELYTTEHTLSSILSMTTVVLVYCLKTLSWWPAIHSLCKALCGRFWKAY